MLVLFLLSILLVVLFSCNVTSYFLIDSAFNFYISKVQVFSSYNEYAELGSKQFLALLGLEDDFIFTQGMQDIFSMEQIYEVIPVNGLYKIDLSTNNEIKLNEKSFVWKIYDRNSIFPANKKDDIIMKIIIRIEPTVKKANTYDIKGNVYTWSFTFNMLQNGVEISVDFQ
ncbi:MAG TPA: hypothetical protein PLI56_01455 [Exilispira sp.]|nr:hypothetical protein [Exilispira sp.]